jgi:16S rRNA (uracil1498-N3)-methyltransferase
VTKTRPRHRFMVDVPLDAGSTVTLTAEQSAQITKVLRLRPGDEIILFNGDGFDYLTVLDHLDGALIGCVSSERWAGRLWEAPSVEVGLSLVKSDRFDLAIQKVVELGASRVTPVRAARCVVTLPVDRAVSRLERWQRVAREAMEQSGRADRVVVSSPVDLDEFVAQCDADHRLIAWERERREGLVDVLERPGDSVAILLGPEGGFEEEEVERATACGFVPVSLGPTTLRSETAAIASVAMIRACAAGRFNRIVTNEEQRRS